MKSVAIEILPATGPEPARRILGVPATIGRGSDADIRLDAANKAISRIHLEVVEEEGAILVVNRASNEGATLAAGRPLPPAARVPLPARGSVRLKVFDTTVVVEPAGALHVVVRTDAAGEAVASDTLQDGRVLRIAIADGKASLEQVDPDEAKTGEGVVLGFFLDRGQPAVMVLANPDKAEVLLDGGRVSQESLYLRPLESLGVAGLRLELLEAGQMALQCVEDDCHALNALTATQCRICGKALASATRRADPAAP